MPRFRTDEEMLQHDRAKRLRVVPPPPPPTTIEKGGLPRSTALAVIGGVGWVALLLIVTMAFFGPIRP